MKPWIVLGSLVWVACVRSELEIRQEPCGEVVTVDQWIERLPPAGEEYRRAEDGEGWVLDPAVTALREHLHGDGVLSDAQWKRALEVSLGLQVRTTWPAELPFAVGVGRPSWIDRGKITVTPRTSGLASATSPAWSFCGNCSDAEKERTTYQELGRLAPGRQKLEFDVTIEGDRGQYPKPPAPLWRGTLALELEVVSTLDAALPGVHDPLLDEVLRRALRITRYGDQLVFEGDLTDVPVFDGTAVSLEVELRQGTERRAQGACRFLREPGATHASLRLELSTPTTVGWSLHVRGVADGTLREWSARRHWNGELVIPLEEL